DFRAVRRVTAHGDALYFLARTGALFFSLDRGRTWDHVLFRFKEADIRQGIMEDLHLRADGTLLSLATLGAKSVLIQRKGPRAADRRWTFQTLGAVYNRILEIKSDAAFPQKAGARSGLYVLGTGGYLVSKNNGPFRYQAARYGKRSP